MGNAESMTSESEDPSSEGVKGILHEVKITCKVEFVSLHWLLQNLQHLLPTSVMRTRYYLNNKVKKSKACPSQEPSPINIMVKCGMPWWTLELHDCVTLFTTCNQYSILSWKYMLLQNILNVSAKNVLQVEQPKESITRKRYRRKPVINTFNHILGTREDGIYLSNV